jgi:squalene cyclase
MSNAKAALLGDQLADGSWPSPGEVGPAATAQTAICLEWAGHLDAVEARRIARYLASEALPSGAFVLFPSAAEGDLGATAFTAAFLAKHGGQETSDLVERANAWVEARGGARAIVALLAEGNLAALYLAMAGGLDPERITTAPLFALTTKLGETWFLRHFHGGILMTAYATRVIHVKLLSTHGRARALERLDDRERAKAIEWLSTFQNPTGNWNAWAPVTALHVAALHASGVDPADARITRAVRWLDSEAVDDGLRRYWNAFDTPLWATLFSMLALLDAGEPHDSAALRRARDWVIAAQCQHPQARVNHVLPKADGGAPRLTGGFAFRADNPVLPDSDDSAAALSALATLRHRGDASSSLSRCIEDLVPWLLGMQNPDGGFSSYVCGLPGKPPGPLFLRTPGVDPASVTSWLRMVVAPPLELGDPSTEDVTGRVLHGLGAVGLRKNAPPVARALAFLQGQQLEDGSFFGRWLTNYLAATSYVVRGALAVGVARDAPWIRRALDFLESKQQACGAFGESIESYRSPETHRGKGPPSPAQTGRVACALLEGRRDASARRALSWLIESQLPCGHWDGSDHLAAIYPPNTFYLHAAAGTYYPLWALALAVEHGQDPLSPSRA